MRSSKSRSRSKANRNRSIGNIINRVFDSSGPEGKVRGTPQQIIEKYLQLARDAQLGNDRVAAENFNQHAEHYTRLLGEAQRELEAERERQGGFQGGGQQGGGQQGGGHQGGQQQPRGERTDQGQGRGEYMRDDRRDDRREDRRDDRREERPDDRFESQPDYAAEGAPQPDVIEVVGEEPESGLVETPENAAPKPARPPRQRRPRGPKPQAEAEAPAGSPAGTSEAAE